MPEQFPAHEAEEEEDVFALFTNMTPPYDEGWIKFEPVPESEMVFSNATSQGEDSFIDTIQSWRPVPDSPHAPPPPSPHDSFYSAQDSLPAAFENVVRHMNAAASSFTMENSAEKDNQAEDKSTSVPNAENESNENDIRESSGNAAIDAFLWDGPRENTAWSCPVYITPSELLAFFPHETNTVYGIAILFQTSWAIEEISQRICIHRDLITPFEVEMVITQRFQQIMLQVLEKDITRSELDNKEIRDEFLRKVGKMPTPRGASDPMLVDLTPGVSVWPEGEESGVLTRAIQFALEYPGVPSRLSGVEDMARTFELEDSLELPL